VASDKSVAAGMKTGMKTNKIRTRKQTPGANGDAVKFAGTRTANYNPRTQKGSGKK